MKYAYILAISLFALTSDFALAGTWIQKSDHGGIARHRAFGFSIGGRGYTGLGHVNSGQVITYEDVWEYDPATDTWTQKANFGGGKRYHCTSFVIGNYGYVGMGEDSASLYRTDIWRFDPSANTWTEVANFPGEERRGTASFVIDGLAYVGTGQATSSYKVDFFKYDPQLDTWSPIAPFIGSARSSAVSFTHNGIGYVGTGHEFGAAVKDFYSYDPIADVWTQKADVGDSLRQDATGFVLNGVGYLGTGNDVTGDYTYKDIWTYDFVADTWTRIENFGGAKRRFAFSFVINGSAYIGGGTNGTNFKDIWVYDPFLSSGKDLLGDNDVRIFPNPCTEYCMVDLSAEVLFSRSSLQLTLMGNDGKILKRQFIDQTQTKVELNDLPKGLYFIQIKDKDKIVYNQKMIRS